MDAVALIMLHARLRTRSSSLPTGVIVFTALIEKVIPGIVLRRLPLFVRIFLQIGNVVCGVTPLEDGLRRRANLLTFPK